MFHAPIALKAAYTLLRAGQQKDVESLEMIKSAA